MYELHRADPESLDDLPHVHRIGVRVEHREVPDHDVQVDAGVPVLAREGVQPFDGPHSSLQAAHPLDELADLVDREARLTGHAGVVGL